MSTAPGKIATSAGVAVNHKVVPPAEWLSARKELLAKEKTFAKMRDELSRQRLELPWEKVSKEYVFDGPQGKETLADLFGSKSQLIVYHFMFGPNYGAGCASCSSIAAGCSPATRARSPSAISAASPSSWS